MNTQPDDQPHSGSTDTAIAQQFSQAAARYQRFSSSFSRTLNPLFSFCDWQLVPLERGVELIISCTSSNVRSQVINSLLPISTRLQSLFGCSKIRVLGGSYPFETSTDEVIRHHRYWKRYDNR
ncbi:MULTISPECIES: hypothetical protein [Trichocoleus]|uniref:Uncharacterized protein n=1 Tax=Trichocoleus desertorum GB2-A4 TaxID=2933944 RepID=A0ABV0J1D1_9CYAN|nr:hypothetical protein [Trichocoleus sp. FACHB-46]MBD1860207.1 hypothetical protein [Trichocoleus sp. FACHB-46]